MDYGKQAARLLAALVHLFTAAGAVAALAALGAAAEGRAAACVLWMLLALAIDGVDGALARRARVAQHLPFIDGRRLDDVVDYLNYVIVPAAFLLWNGFIESYWVVAAAIIASAYGFAQRNAKTAGGGAHAFVGFPSYWNVVAIYLWLFNAPVAFNNWLLCILAAMVFVPLPYLYPSRMGRGFWLMNIGAALWMLCIAFCVAAPATAAQLWLRELSLLYPAAYMLFSVQLWRGRSA